MVRREDEPAPVRLGPGQVHPDRPVLAQASLRRFQAIACRARAARREPSGTTPRSSLTGLVVVPRRLAHVGPDRVALTLSGSLCDDPLGLDPVRLLAAYVGPGSGHRPLRGVLLGADLLGVRAEPAAVPPHLPVPEVADPVHPLEQLAVVADEQKRARPGAEDVMEPGPGRAVEVVGRLIEEQHVRPEQEQPRETEPDHLATGQLADPPVEEVGGAARAGRARRSRAPRRPSRRRPPRGPPGRRSRRRASRRARSGSAMPRRSSTWRSRSRVRSCGR